MAHLDDQKVWQVKQKSVQQGTQDRASLERLWRAERHWVAAVLLAHMPRGADLEDLLQEVAVILVERLESLRDPARLRGWLRSVALNVARGVGRRTRFPRPLEAARQMADPAPELLLKRVEAREEAAHVLEVAANLPVPYRDRWTLGCAYEEPRPFTYGWNGTTRTAWPWRAI